MTAQAIDERKSDDWRDPSGAEIHLSGLRAPRRRCQAAVRAGTDGNGRIAWTENSKIPSPCHPERRSSLCEGPATTSIYRKKGIREASLANRHPGIDDRGRAQRA